MTASIYDFSSANRKNKNRAFHGWWWNIFADAGHAFRASAKRREYDGYLNDARKQLRDLIEPYEDPGLIELRENYNRDYKKSLRLSDEAYAAAMKEIAAQKLQRSTAAEIVKTQKTELKLKIKNARAQVLEDIYRERKEHQLVYQEAVRSADSRYENAMGSLWFWQLGQKRQAKRARRRDNDFAADILHLEITRLDRNSSDGLFGFGATKLGRLMKVGNLNQAAQEYKRQQQISIGRLELKQLIEDGQREAAISQMADMAKINKTTARNAANEVWSESYKRVKTHAAAQKAYHNSRWAEKAKIANWYVRSFAAGSSDFVKAGGKTIWFKLSKMVKSQSAAIDDTLAQAVKRRRPGGAGPSPH